MTDSLTPTYTPSNTAVADAWTKLIAPYVPEASKPDFSLRAYFRPDLMAPPPPPSNLEIREPAADQTVPFGTLKSGEKEIRLELVPSFLQNTSGAIVELTRKEAITAINGFNTGTTYGDGSEAEICKAVANGKFQDGSFFLARATDLREIAVGKTNPALQGIHAAINGEEPKHTWCVSSSNQTTGEEVQVRLSDAKTAGFIPDREPSRVIVLRGFNQAAHLNPA